MTEVFLSSCLTNPMSDDLTEQLNNVIPLRKEPRLGRIRIRLTRHDSRTYYFPIGIQPLEKTVVIVSRNGIVQAPGDFELGSAGNQTKVTTVVFTSDVDDDEVVEGIFENQL